MKPKWDKPRVDNTVVDPYMSFVRTVNDHDVWVCWYPANWGVVIMKYDMYVNDIRVYDEGENLVMVDHLTGAKRALDPDVLAFAKAYLVMITGARNGT